MKYKFNGTSFKNVLEDDIEPVVTEPKPVVITLKEVKMMADGTDQPGF